MTARRIRACLPTRRNSDVPRYTTWAVGRVHTLRSDIELYLGYNHFELDRTGAQDVDIVVVGSRLHF